MTDHLPSKELSKTFGYRFAKEWYELGTAAMPNTLRYQLAQRMMDEADREIERLETALRGIQSCSTCEACRGAATLALAGGVCVTPPPCPAQIQP